MSTATATYTCPVCFWGGLDEDPALRHYNICPCCGTEFGNDDMDESHDELRFRWAEAGYPWWSTRLPAPPYWDPKAQLERGLPERPFVNLQAADVEGEGDGVDEDPAGRVLYRGI